MKRTKNEERESLWIKVDHDESHCFKHRFLCEMWGVDVFSLSACNCDGCLLDDHIVRLQIRATEMLRK